MRWFGLRERDLIWKCADLIYNYLIWFAAMWFDLQFEQITDWTNVNCSKFLGLEIKEYQPTTNRYCVCIELKYVDCTISNMVIMDTFIRH